MAKSYCTLGGHATATITEKKSEFIAAAAPVQTEEAALAFLAEVRAKHRTASHNVYAYSLRQDARQRYSDDGEPAKTAGLPVLSVITHANVVDCIVVVTRYFGGTLLGTGGLVRAYTQAAQAALAASKIVMVRLCVGLRLRVAYNLYEQVLRLLQQAGAQMEEPVFGADVELRVTLPAGQEGGLLEKLRELCRGEADVSVGEPFYAPLMEKLQEIYGNET